MAIKVGGTTVVDDSRGLTNIATVDATTAASISAAGVGGGGEHDFVASGTISNGDVVVLNSDGTVGPVEVPYSTITPVEGSPTVFQSGTLDSDVSTVYDPSSQKMVIVYEGGAKVATVSGTSISFGSAASAGFTGVNKAVYDPSSGTVVVFYRTTGGVGEARVGTVSGTSITFGTAVTFASSVAGSSKIAAAYDPSSGKIFVAYKDSGDSNKGKARVGTVSGTSISFGSTATFETAQVEGMTASYDPNEEAVLLVYDDVTNLYAVRACMATISGTSVSFGSKSTIESGTIYAIMECEYDTASQKHGLFAASGSAVGRVLTVSGSSVSAGSIVTIDSINGALYPSVAYDSNTNRFVFAYKQGSSNDGFYSLVTISGTSMTFTTPAQFESTQTKQTSVGFNVADNRAVIAYIDEGNSYSGTAVVLHTSDAGASNVADWVGIAAENISNAATGAVSIAGGVNSQQSGLTIDATYYVDGTGSLTTTDTGYLVGRAVAADSILLSDSTLTGLPSQTGNDGLYLTTNGTTATWSPVAGGSAFTAF